jgi:hypothetical protein
MSLITVYYDIETAEGIPHTKAIIDERALPFFLTLGFTREPGAPQVIPDADEEYDLGTDPDKGFGVPGSMDWHKTQLADMNTKKEVIEYVDDENWKPAKRLTLPKLKAAALKLLGDKENG